MTNTIIGDATVSAATVHQCVGSLGGGGTVPGSHCLPEPATTTGATITQCDGSVTGTGNFMVCTVDPTSQANSAFDVSVNQCNGSADGNGSVLVCDVQITTLVQPADDDSSGGGDDSGGDGTGGSASDGDGLTLGADGVSELAATGALPVHGALGGLAIALLLAGAVLTRNAQPGRARQHRG